MTNLRVVRLSVKDNKTIEILFTHNLDTNLGAENVSIVAVSGGLNNPTVTSVVPQEKILTISLLPLIPQTNYRLTLSSTTSQPFKGSKGEELVEDGSNNVIFFVGRGEDNSVRDAIIDDLPDVYIVESGDLIYDTIDVGAKQILNSAHAAGEVRSANYVSLEATDIEMTRGAGPYDRFPDEGVYQILRVGSAPTASNEKTTITFDAFPVDQISLQQIFVTAETISNASNDSNSFEGLIISASKNPIIKVTSITLERDGTTYTYDISQYKYGIKNSKYDSINAYPAVDLESNQIRLSAAAVGSFPFPQGSDVFTISYYYKKEGRDVDSNSIEIYTSVDAVRRPVSALATSFFLENAPVIDSNGDVPSLNGVTWLDPAQNFDPTKKHPAFVTEIAYSSSNLPKTIGEYSVNYETGQVFVYGVNGSGVDGTTSVPPTATYKYKKVYQENLDYIFFSDTDEIVSIPNRDLRGNPATIVFNYEDTFADGTDFEFASHVEIINERVNNQLIEDIGIYTQYSPVNEVFRIYNETTGEIYTPTRVSGNEVYFSSVQAPRTFNISREAGIFESIIQSQLVITSTTSGTSFNIFTIELSDSDIVSANGGFIAANFNTSLSFSENDLFKREFYYSPSKILSENLQRLEKIGDYIVDYESGIVYLAVSFTQSSDIGDATYKRNYIKPKNKHIIRVDDVYRSYSVTQPNTQTFKVGTVADTTIIIPDLDHVGETTVSDSAITVLNDKFSVSSDIFRLRHIFQVTDLQTSSEPIDFVTGATFSSNTVTLSSAGVQITDDGYGSGIIVQTDGSREYIVAKRIETLATQNLMQLVSASSITKFDGGNTNYYIQGSDAYVDSVNNRIYLPSGSNLAGTMVEAKYKVKLRDGSAVLADYITGDIFIDYTYTSDELLISYEYGDNVLDWSISDSLEEGDTYYVTYRYGALRDALRDNFGALTSLPELAVIPDNLDRETYRNAISGSLQSFLKGPIIPAIKSLVSAFTQIEPNITESVFQEWILGRDHLKLSPMSLTSLSSDDMPTYLPGKFGNGLYLSKSGQKAMLPASSNMKFSEGTWEAFVTPTWNGLQNDATLSFNLKMDNVNIALSKIFIGSGATNPTSIPFSLDRENSGVWGTPYNLHNQGVSGYFIWFDNENNCWRLRTRAPISENRLFSGNISSSGEFYNVKIASSASGYDGYDGYEIDEINDRLWSTDESVKFSFIVDGYDVMNMAFDAYDAYDSYGTIAGFDGIDFVSGNIHYFFDAGVEENKCRMSLYKNGSGFLKFIVYDNNGRVKALSYNIQDWLTGETHHLATSWKIGTIEQQDELHLFVDGDEVPNIYRFKGYLDIPANVNKNTYPFTNPVDVPNGSLFLDEASETLVLSASKPTMGGFDLSSTANSNVCISLSADFSSVAIGSRFEIIDHTTDGIITQNFPYVYVSNIIGQNILELEVGDINGLPGSGTPWNATYTLNNIQYSINPLKLRTVSDPNIEKVRVFVKDSLTTSELNSPDTLTPQYSFSQDGYMDYVNVYDGVSIGDDVLLKTYGLKIARCIQEAYVWGDRKSNLLNIKTPAPTAISKINVTNIIAKRTHIENGEFAIIATLVGGHLVTVLTSNVEFCQPSNTITGRSLTAIASGDNIDWTGLNRIIIVGDTTDGSGIDILDFSGPGKQTTTKFFTSILDINATFTPIDSSLTAGAMEIRETYPINWSEDGGLFAEIHLSVQEQAGHIGTIASGTKILDDAYSRFGQDDIGKTINIISPPVIAGSYTITDVLLDSSGLVKDSSSVVLNHTFSADYTNISWRMINTSYSDSGFANGLLTFETARTGGTPFLLRGCWHEVDLPVYLVIPWENTPETLFIGSDMSGENQADAVIDELRILDEISSDTHTGEQLPSSGRSVTTDAQAVKAYETTDQTLVLLHFDDTVDNDADFITSFAGSYRQSENSVNSNFGQSAVFNTKKALKVDNTSIFKNNEGTIEFWVSPILDTFNDPSYRYYVDLSSELVTTATVTTSLLVILPVRARSVTSITVSGNSTNYFIGGSLASDGITVKLGQPLPFGTSQVSVTYVPIVAQGDRFSIFKTPTSQLVFSVTASGVDYQISVPVYWKKNTWHRVWAGWDLNNSDNQDRLIFMVDGTEGGTIRYGTGLIYGTGVLYGQKTVWGSADVGTTISRNILADINLLDSFNTINIGADFTEQFTALARMDNIRFSTALRPVTYLGATVLDTVVGSGPGRLIAKDLLYTANSNTALPVIEDALTGLLLDFNTTESEVEYLAQIRDASTGIFDFFVEVIDTFELVDTELAHQLITDLINEIKPSHTRAFVSFTK